MNEPVIDPKENKLFDGTTQPENSDAGSEYSAYRITHHFFSKVKEEKGNQQKDIDQSAVQYLHNASVILLQISQVFLPAK